MLQQPIFTCWLKTGPFPGCWHWPCRDSQYSCSHCTNTSFSVCPDADVHHTITMHQCWFKFRFTVGPDDFLPYCPFGSCGNWHIWYRLTEERYDQDHHINPQKQGHSFLSQRETGSIWYKAQAAAATWFLCKGVLRIIYLHSHFWQTSQQQPENSYSYSEHLLWDQ